MPERTLTSIIENFSLHGNETAYVQRNGYRIDRWSYREVLDASRRFARELELRGVQSGERVFIWGENCAEWVAAFFGALLRNTVVVPMDRTASPEYARRVLNQVRPALCVCSRQLLEVCADIPSLALENLAETVSRHSGAPYPVPNINAGSPAEIVFTSGTTAEPRGVVLTHRNVLANLDPLEREIRKYLKYERIVHPLRFMNLLPLSHTFGQFMGLFLPQVLGGTVIFQNTLNPSDIVRAVRRERVSVCVAVPKVLEALKDKLERDLESAGEMNRFRKQVEKARRRHFLKRWWIFRRLHGKFGWKFWAFICGGAKLREETEKFWSDLGFAVIQGYGLTETTSLISVNHPLKVSGGSIGKILPGREIRLAPDGEILVRGANIAGSYYQGKIYSPVADEDGWFRTGDIGALDEDGNLYFKGRRKNVIVGAEGMNIYPEDLEAALRRQPEIRDCVVVPVETDGNPEVCAVILLADRNQAPDPVIRRTNGTLAEYQHIRRWIVWPDDDFPRTSTQKPKLGEIQAFADSKTSMKAVKEAEGGILPDLIRQITGRRIETVETGSRLGNDLDLSSIERVELLGALEDRFQVDLDESGFTEAGTIGDLEAMLAQPSTRRSNYAYPRWTQRWPVAALRTLFYYLLVGPLVRLMAHPKVYGLENLKDLHEPALFVSNHVTQVDVPCILAALPPRHRHRLAVAMMGEMLEGFRHPAPGLPVVKRWVSRIQYGLVVALFNVFPLPQKTGFRASFAFAGESVDRGHSILVFPEGGRTQDGEMRPFRAGTGILATNLNIPVVPMRLDGLYDLKKRGKYFARSGAVSVKIGAAVRYDSDTNPSEIARDLQSRVSRV